MELCANLNQGGMTPSIGDIEEAVSAVKGSGTAVHVLIRPRPGDFNPKSRDVVRFLCLQVMAKDVAAAVKAGAHGVVIGALLEKGGIDEEITAELIRVARATAAPCSCSITFHRAFDCCATGATAALETLIRWLGVDRVLTSGRAESAWAGRDTIARLVEAGQERIVVIPGAGVSRTNVKQLLIHTGAKEVHVGSGCHENIPWGSPRESSVSLGPSEGPSAVVRRVSRRLVSEILDTLA
ncbi:unnamed protein product [Ascophyllum nodosum]